MRMRLGAAALLACLWVSHGAGAAPAGTAARPAHDAPARVLLAAAADSPQEIAQLMARGDELLATGDLAAARLCYRRAADDGYAKAATALGTTYDPLYFRKWNIRGTRPEPLTAAEWYRKAAALGDGAATAKLRERVASGNLPEERPTLKEPAAALAALPGLGQKAGAGRLTRQSVEAILGAAGASYRMIPPEEFKVDYPGINYAWVTNDEVFGAVIQVDTGNLSAEDAALAFVAKINSGCAGKASVTVGPVDALKGEAKTRRAASECATDAATTRVEYAFIHNRAEMTVFMALSPSREAAERHSDALLATVRKMILAAN